MVYSLGFDKGDQQNRFLRPLDGNLREIEYEDTTPDPNGVSGFFERGTLLAGRSIKDQGVPTKLKWTGVKSKFLDVIVSQSAIYVSEKFKTAVEALEPGTHQFFRCEVHDQRKNLIEGVYFFNICNRIDGTDPNKTTAIRPRNIAYDPLSGEIVFSKKLIGDRHLWIDRLIYDGIYVSDELHALLIQNKTTGVSFGKRSVVE